jgi:hypothetical protein
MQWGTFVRTIVKGIVSKLTIKFWMCQKCGKMKDYNKKMTTSNNYKINLAISFSD